MPTDDQKARLAEHAKNAPMPGTTARPPVEGQPCHIDGDYMAYYCSGGDDTSTGEARQGVLERVRRACEVSGSTRPIVHLSDPQSNKGLRYLIAQAKPYQGQRDGGRKPKNWDYLRDYLSTHEGTFFEVKNWRDREADDGMAYVAEAAASLGRPAAIYTRDKDMRMFAGIHVTWGDYEIVDVARGTFDIVYGGKQYGHKFFWYQMLAGDAADNIPGLPRVGEAAADKALHGVKSNEEAFEAVRDFYVSKMRDNYSEHFVEQAALLWMRTDKNANVLDFMNMPGVEWTIDIQRAASRMRDRVHEARDALHRISQA